ncbi:MAG: hypothetical protein KAW40_03570, partial [Candidatus Aenigmarchaeota archaeon]|nr:hypothetical protein [Candidatus Aenigmarchaeota archaeon]
GITKRKEKEIMKRLNNRNMKSNIGQIQLIAVVLFLILVPAVVITAQNATNLTENVSVPLEGYMTANNEGVTSNLSESDNILEELVSNITNETGQNKTSIEPPNISINETGNETINVTENVTEPVNETNVTFVPPEVRIKGIRYPYSVNVSEEFEVEVGIISLYNVSDNITFEIIIPEVFEGENLIWDIPFLDENGSLNLTGKVKANECGNYTLTALVENNFSMDSKDFGVSVLCPPGPPENISVEAEENVTENVTEPVNETNVTFVPPEIKIKGIRYPEYVNVSEEFEVEAEITSLHGISNDVSVELEVPPNFKAKEKIQTISYLLENDSVSFEWKLETGDECGDFVFNVVAKANESEDFESFVLDVKCPIPPSLKTISYDPVTDTITVIGNGTHCTASNPCTLTDIYNADQENGWNQIKQYVSYYLFNASVVIGDGKNETWVIAENEYIDIWKPWTIKKNAGFRMGKLVDGVPLSGGWILSKVEVDYENKERSAFYVESGAALEMYNSYYKVFSKKGENNLFIEDGANFQSEFFGVERETNFNFTTFKFPEKSISKDFIKNRYVKRKGENVTIDLVNLILINPDQNP